MGWNGIKNGELLKLMLENSFDVLVTFDKNLQFQQNFNKYPFPVLVLVGKNNTYRDLQELVPNVLKTLSQGLAAGATIISA